jgi:hypothetical protein
MIASIVVWFVKALALIALTILAFPLAPILALFIVYAEESTITGFPSLLPGTPRAFLIPALRLWQSPDAPVDEFWYGDYSGWPKDGHTQAQYDLSAWLRYLCRVNWLWRNAAYGFGSKLGYPYRLSVEDGPLWRSGVSCSYFWKVVNGAGQIGWCYKAEWFFTKTRYVEVYLGYKLMGDSIQSNKFVAIQFNPFRTI